jgi:hypothetical protein
VGALPKRNNSLCVRRDNNRLPFPSLNFRSNTTVFSNNPFSGFYPFRLVYVGVILSYFSLFPMLAFTAVQFWFPVTYRRFIAAATFFSLSLSLSGSSLTTSPISQCHTIRSIYAVLSYKNSSSKFNSSILTIAILITVYFNFV